MNVVIAPRRSFGTAAIAVLAGVAVGGLAGALLVDVGVPADAKTPIAIVAAVLIAGIGAVVYRLAAGRGGIVVDEQTRRLGLGVTSVRDTWWLPLDGLAGVRVAPMAVAGSSIERWIVGIESHDARQPTIVLADSDAREAIDQLAEALAERSGLRLLAAEGPRATPVKGPATPMSQTFAVSRGAALQALLTLFGAALVAVGVVAFMGLRQDPVLGFIFGPVLLVLGAVLLAVATVKALAREELSYDRDGQAFVHAFRLGRLRWGARRVRATEPTWRIWLLGMRGGYLELRGDDGALIMAAGATTQSRGSLADLQRLAASFVPLAPGDDASPKA